MLIALTGLHGAGKTYFAKNIPKKFGFHVYNKNKLVEYIYKNEYKKEDWQEWYYHEFNKNIYNITSKILSYLPLETDIVLDAVHNNIEWKVINSIIPNSILAVITTPDRIRINRREQNDEMKDISRIQYWHSSGNGDSMCLLSQAEWSFNGAASLDVNERSFQELVELMHRVQKNKKQIKCVLDDKEKQIFDLIETDKSTQIKLEKAKLLLLEYEKYYNNVNREDKSDER